MITLIHGDDIETSRNELTRLKDQAKTKEIRVLDGRSIDESSLTQALQSSSMFGEDTAIFIENLFGKLGRKIKLIETLAKILMNSTADVVIWENKEVSPSVVKSIPKANVKLYKLPSIIFQFLDGISPRSASRLLPLYESLVETEAQEIVFSMLVRRIRQLIQVSNGVTPEGMQGWQVSRLTRQAKSFTIDKLLSMYKKLLDIESSIKTGSSPFTLRQLTEKYLLDL